MKILIKALATSPHLTISKLYNNLKSMGYGAGKTTLANYIEHLKDSFIVFTVFSQEKSYKKQEMLGFKPYFVDNGLLNIMGCDKSRLLENLVFTELIKRGITDIYYYITKRGEEVDFLIKDRNKSELIEVTCEPDEDHVTRVKRAMNELGIKRAVIISEDEDDVIRTDVGYIEIKPLWKWLSGLD